jgi:hypothetical protein
VLDEDELEPMFGQLAEFAGGVVVVVDGVVAVVAVVAVVVVAAAIVPLAAWVIAAPPPATAPATARVIRIFFGVFISITSFGFRVLRSS